MSSEVKSEKYTIVECHTCSEELIKDYYSAESHDHAPHIYHY